MTCSSGSVQSAADKTVAAANQVKKLQTMLQGQEAEHKKVFYQDIDMHLADAKVGDAREISYAFDIKTEYTSEFSLDKIAAVVTSALNALVKATDPTVPKPATSPAAIEAYSAVVNTVAEAAKSSAQSAASLSFSMNRLSPGVFAFLYASSVNILDKDTFGSEAVTSTAIYYRLMQSIDDVKQGAAFDASLIDAKNLIQMKQLQAALTEELAEHKFDVDVWLKKDDAFTAAIARLQARLDADKFDHRKPLRIALKHGFGRAIDHSFQEGSSETQQIVETAIKRLETMGPTVRRVIEVSEARLKSRYY